MVASPDHHIQASDLAETIGTFVERGRVNASYMAGEGVFRVHGVQRLLSIGLTNTDVSDRPPAERDALLMRVALACVDWLRGRELPVPATLVSISLLREIDLRLISWSWGVGGRVYWIDSHGAPTQQAPSAIKAR